MTHKLLPVLSILVLMQSIQADVRTERYRLNNGLEVLLMENPALPMVGMNMIIRTGSAYETFASSGMSHMLEHLLFNGTERRDQRALYDDTDRIGGYNNAHTSTYYTNFMMVVPAAQVLAGMDIQADMLFHSTLPEEKFEKEKGIVLEEIAQGLSKPSTRVEWDLQTQLYAGHALALPTLGTYATIEHMTRDEVNAYYRNHYRPNNMMLSVIGNFDSDTLLAHVEELYGSAAPADVHPEESATMATGFHPPRPTPVMERTVRSYEGEDAIVNLIYSLPEKFGPRALDLLGEALEDFHDPLNTVLETAFGEGFKDSKFEVRATPVARHLVVTLSADPQTDLDALAAQSAEFLARQRYRFTDAELHALATANQTHFLQNLEKPHMFGIYYSDLLAEMGFDGALDYLQQSDYSGSARQLRRFRLKNSPRVLIHLPGQIGDASAAATVQTRLLREGPGGGLIVRQNSGSQLLAVHILYEHKAYWESRYGEKAAEILHDCFGQRMESPEIQAAGENFGLSFTVNDNPYIPMDNIYLHPDFGYIRVEGLASDLPGALHFLFNNLDGFVPTREEYDRAAAKFSHGMQTMGRNLAGEHFRGLLDSVLYEASPYPMAGQAISYEQLLEFAQGYFVPGNRLISIVSPASPEVLDGLVPRSTAAGQAQDAAWEKHLKAQDGPITLEEEGNGERSYVFWGFVHEIEAVDQAPLQALSLILSDRIVFDVREKQGLAYRMSAGIHVDGNRALFSVNLGTRPQNVDVLLPQFPTLLSTATVADLSAAELEKSLNMYLGRMMFRRLSSINQAYYLGTSQYFHGDMHADEQEQAALASVTLADVQRVANKYLRTEQPIRIIVR